MRAKIDYLFKHLFFFELQYFKQNVYFRLTIATSIAIQNKFLIK